MEITITHNINLNAPALIDLFQQAMKANGVTPVKPGNTAKAPAPAVPAAATTAADATTGASEAPPAFLKKEVAAAEAAAEPVKGKGKKAAPAPVASTNPAGVSTSETFPGDPAAWTKEEKEKYLAIVRGRLSDYSADKRYGMPGVFKILADFGVDRITALPIDQYATFKQRIDDALSAAPVDPLA